MTDLYRTIMTIAAQTSGVEPEKVLTRVHKHEFTTARYIGWYVLHTRFGWSHSRIQREAVLFHRVTVRNGINRIGEMPNHSVVGELVERVLAEVSFP
jgi:hypothetical protein